VLKIHSPKAKMLYGESGSFLRNVVNNIIKINLPAPDWHDGALLTVRAKAGDLVESIKDGSKV
jgi:hypothetical protein